MGIGNRRDSRSFRPREERLEERLVMSGASSVPAEVRAILASSPGGSPVRPNTPVLPLFSPFATATFIDPTVSVVAGNRTAVGLKDFIAPFVKLNAKNGVIKIGSSSTIQDHASLIANPNHQSGLTGIFVGDNVVIGDGAVVRGPSAIGVLGGSATSIGANALIDGAIIEPGAFVGALARVGPGVVVPTGFRVLPGANVTTSAQASDPTLGKVVRVTPSDNFASTATKEIAANSALASGYAALFNGNSATGGAASSGPVPGPIAAGGSTIFFGALNTVLGASGEPGSKTVNFEPAAGVPLFLSNGALAPVSPNASYNFPARVIGLATFQESPNQVKAVIGKGDSIRADEGQPFAVKSIAKLGNGVSVHSPLGGIQGTTTTTIVTTTTIPAGVTTTTSTTSVVNSTGAPTATAGTTTATTSGTNAQGLPFTGTTTTTIATKTTSVGGITIGQGFQAFDGAVILGGPSAISNFGDDVTVGAGAVISTSSIGSGSFIGNRAYIANSIIPAGSVVPAGAIIINNTIVGTVQW